MKKFFPGIISPVMLLLPFGLMAAVMLFTHCQPSGQETVAGSELHARALKHFEPLPEHAFEEGMDRSQELIDLGRMLYYEPRLSKSGIISCNTCHSLTTFGVDQTPVSIGHQWQEGPLNAPTVLNAALHKTQFWNGRAKDVEEQAGMPILDPLEMAATEEHVLAVLQSIPEYVERFQQAFPEKETPLVYENVGNAIGAFERILLTPSPFDAFLQGDERALTDSQKKGLEVFLDQGCMACHNGPVLGGQIFTFFQTPAERESGKANLGRFEFTQREADKHFFKVPSLLNIEMTYPYLHDGSEWDLGTTIGIVARDMLGKELTGEETALIIAFLGSLTGEIPAYAREIPVLPPSTATTPRPDFN